jgi:hypothetical protein
LPKAGIAESWFVYDRLGWLQQLGAVLSPEAITQRL